MLKIILLAVAVFALAGCKPPDQNSPSVSTTTNAAGEVVSDKADLTSQMHAQLDKLKAELNDLGAKIESGSETVKAEAQPKLQTLRAKIADLDQQLDKAKDTSASKWEEFKAGFKKSSEDVKSSLEQASQWVKDKVSPSASTN